MCVVQGLFKLEDEKFQMIKHSGRKAGLVVSCWKSCGRRSNILSIPFSPNWGPQTEWFVDKNLYRLTCCQLLTNGLRASVYISQIFHPCTGWGAQLLGGLFKNQECQPSTCVSKPWNTRVRTCMMDVQLPIVLLLKNLCETERNENL